MNRTTFIGNYRTEDPKFTTYWSNGTGRDSYIVFDDGGMHPLP